MDVNRSAKTGRDALMTLLRVNISPVFSLQFLRFNPQNRAFRLKFPGAVVRSNDEEDRRAI
jgi:hypothetical protein